MNIPFNKPHLTGDELVYIKEAVLSGKLSGNGEFTRKCQRFFETRYGFTKTLLTTSGTDALEMAAMLCDVGPGDEVIVPSYTFVSTALAFARQGASIVFADSCRDNPNLDTDKLEALITPRTKVIVPVHYAGVACDMDKIMDIAGRHGLFVVEDAAHAVDACYKGRPLGGIGHFGCFSFHETKNVSAGGEGGMLCINDARFVRRAEIIWEKGTNRAEFFRGMVNKYGWVDTGSSFLPSEVNSAFLYAQLENLNTIQSRRKQLWQHYYEGLKDLAEMGLFTLPDIPDYATNNAHMFYLVCRSLQERTGLIASLKERGIYAAFHYLSLHWSDYYTAHHCGDIPALPDCDRFADCLVRLPMFYELKDEELGSVIDGVKAFYKVNSLPVDSRLELVREFLKSDDRPKYILGTSETARKVYCWLVAGAGDKRRDIKGFLDEFSKAGSFENLPVLHSLSGLEPNAIVLNTVYGVIPITMKKRLDKAGVTNIDYFTFIRESGYPADISFWEGFRESYLSRKAEFDAISDRFADSLSREVYADLMYFRLHYDLAPMAKYTNRPMDQYFEPFLNLQREGEVFCDVGGFDGDTTELFIRHCPDYRQIWFFEPIPGQMEKAKKRLEGHDNIKYCAVAVSDHPGVVHFSSSGTASKESEEGSLTVPTARIDDMVDSRITFLKMDIEGAESRALDGARETIRKYHPRLAICVYHKGADYIDIPKQVLSIRDDYDLYLRHYTEGVTETVMYFIPHQ